jgi:cytochrome c peroxidase
MNARTFLIVFVIALVVAAGAVVIMRYAGTETEMATAPAKPVGQVVEIAAPLGLPPVPVPADNPPTAETIALGRKLYYDTRLSVDNTVSCASCHDPKFGFSDGKKFSTGVQNKTGTRNSPTVFNAAYYDRQFWDGRAPSLEKQAEGPVENPVEMAHTLAGAVQKLSADPETVKEFEAAFGPGPITVDKMTKAIAAFERTIVSANSPFDRFYFGGDKRALSPAAQRGFKIFMDEKKANCAVCHTVGGKHALFTDNKFHNIGIGADTRGNLTDEGRYKETKNPADLGAFKTPSLRNVAQTAPYMHDGSIQTLKDVMDYYIGGGNTNSTLSPHMKPLDHLTFQERKDLLAFLESLTGEMPKDVGPPPQLATQPTKGAAKKGL